MSTRENKNEQECSCSHLHYESLFSLLSSLPAVATRHVLGRCCLLQWVATNNNTNRDYNSKTSQIKLKKHSQAYYYGQKHPADTFFESDSEDSVDARGGDEAEEANTPPFTFAFALAIALLAFTLFCALVTVLLLTATLVFGFSRPLPFRMTSRCLSRTAFLSA
jgi:hypothetical protein